MTGTMPQKRLAELNAPAEDPRSLERSAKRAQKVMRERTALDEPARRRASSSNSDVDDAVTLIELGEAEGDEAVVAEAERRHVGARRTRPRACRSRRCCPAKPTATTPMSRSMPAPAAPRARTGRRCCCACMRAGPSSTDYKVELIDEMRRRRGRHQIGDRCWSRATTPMAGSRRNRACTAWCASRPTIPTRAGTPPLPRLGLSGGRRPHRVEINEVGLPDRHLSLLRRRRPACQHDRFGGAHHPSADRHRRRVPERTLAAQEPRHRLDDAARPDL